MTTMRERFVHLQEATAAGAQIEQLLLLDDVLTKGAVSTANPGLSSAYLVVLQSRQKAIFKPFGGQHPNACKSYDQTAIEAPVHEVVAWRLAHALGPPWDQLVPAAVLRDISDLGGGALINFRTGGPDLDVFTHAPSQVTAAAFWDALIGQQDRHARNFRYDAANKQLALIDNAFAFARPGALAPNSLFLAARRSAHGAGLRPQEKEALSELLTNDIYGLRNYLEPSRADAFEARAERMLSRGCLPLPSAF